LARATQHAAARRATPTSLADRLTQQTSAFLRTDQHSARRELIEDIRADKKSWARHGLAALAVSVLGLGVAGSVALTGAAQPQQATVAVPKVEVSVQPGVAKPSAFDREKGTTSRANSRPALDPEKVNSRADQRAEALTKADDRIEQAAQSKAVTAREKSLDHASDAAQKQAAVIAAGRSTKSSAGRSSTKRSFGTFAALSSARSSGRSCLPVTSGYTIAARFGQVGAWARYHTGIDFSAPVGTPIHAPASGVVTNAGGGSASGWAGNYVAIRYSDGAQSLMAHMSTVSVSVGQTVSRCQVVGAVGMTGRTFGPHVHFEIYPAGVSPGDVYRAVNPSPWLSSHGLNV
jgi:murein DD-endopeptidase MepM/ murein hydrolase activator NlpD